MRCLVAVVDHGSFRRAAEALPLAQPAVSTHVARLEAELGIALLRRSRRGAEPTDEGRALLPSLRGLLETEAEIAAAALDLRTGGSGRVRVAAVNAVLAPLVVPALAGLGRSTDIVVDLDESTPDAIEAALAEGRADIGLTAHAGRIRPSGRAERLGRDAIGLCARRDDPLASRQSASLPDLAGHRLVLHTEGLLRRLAVGYFPERVVEHAIEVSHHFTALDLVTAGLGVALTPRLSLDRYPDLAFVPVSDADLAATLWMVVTDSPSPATVAVAGALRDTARRAVAPSIDA